MYNALRFVYNALRYVHNALCFVYNALHYIVFCTEFQFKHGRTNKFSVKKYQLYSEQKITHNSHPLNYKMRNKIKISPTDFEFFSSIYYVMSREEIAL